MRVCCLIEPDVKRIASALIASSGLVKGTNKSEELAAKLVDFLDQLQSIVSHFAWTDTLLYHLILMTFKLKIPNEFVLNNHKNLTIITKIIQMTATKFIQDKGIDLILKN